MNIRWWRRWNIHLLIIHFFSVKMKRKSWRLLSFTKWLILFKIRKSRRSSIHIFILSTWIILIIRIHFCEANVLKAKKYYTTFKRLNDGKFVSLSWCPWLFIPFLYFTKTNKCLKGGKGKGSVKNRYRRED